jgi:hypothetical protein
MSLGLPDFFEPGSNYPNSAEITFLHQQLTEPQAVISDQTMSLGLPDFLESGSNYPNSAEITFLHEQLIAAQLRAFKAEERADQAEENVNKLLAENALLKERLESLEARVRSKEEDTSTQSHPVTTGPNFWNGSLPPVPLVSTEHLDGLSPGDDLSDLLNNDGINPDDDLLDLLNNDGINPDDDLLDLLNNDGINPELLSFNLPSP